MSKRFGATQALADVDFDLAAGEVHALVGENGAGKSTLGKVIGGIHRTDAGELRIEGRLCGRAWDTRHALDQGVAMIQQELSLVPGLTVAQNVFLGIEQHRLGVLSRGLRRRFEALANDAGFRLPPDVAVSSLSIAERQKVETLRALARNAQVVIMDEPTSSLSAYETAALHDLIQRLREQSRGIVYVTHFLEDALTQADRITIMRDGRVVRTTYSHQETKESLVEGMLGRPMDVIFPTLPSPPPVDTDPALVLRDVVSAPGVRGVSLQVRPGEIVGLAGLVGSGRSELLRTIFGVQPLLGGQIDAGEPYLDPSPRKSVSRGIALVPEDRHRQGLVFTQPVRQNVTLPHLAHFSRGGTVQRKRERRAVGELLTQLGVVPQQIEGDVGLFSGGNQQKILFAKWMARPPRVVLLDEPTRGVDVGAKQKVYEVIVELARGGAAVLLVSSELDEVLGLSHRVKLIDQGKLVGEIDPRQHTSDDVLYRLFGLDDELRRSPTRAEESDRG